MEASPDHSAVVVVDTEANPDHSAVVVVQATVVDDGNNAVPVQQTMQLFTPRSGLYTNGCNCSYWSHRDDATAMHGPCCILCCCCCLLCPCWQTFYRIPGTNVYDSRSGASPSDPIDGTAMWLSNTVYKLKGWDGKDVYEAGKNKMTWICGM
mmetsp:Transcript_29594/g.58112  ORF Transcript_29594/g.58112 Transcript_29594/m.58112 type:complete len:152 (-) Transcript_29594:139-594(-)